MKVYYEKSRIIKHFKGKYVNGLVRNGEALAFLRSLKDESASIIFLDPPFNLGKKYSQEFPKLDCRPEKEYEFWIINILEECIRILCTGGAIYLYHIPKWAMVFGTFLKQRLDFKHWIAISMKNGFVRGLNLYPAHYALLYFTKGPPISFNRPKIAPLKCRHCSKLIKDYGGYWKLIEAKGINLSDFWEDLSPVRHKIYKNRESNELPSKILERIIEISGKKDTLFVDPFAGTGIGVLSASKAGMRFDACDLIYDNCEIICERLTNLRKLIIKEERNGNLQSKCAPY